MKTEEEINVEGNSVVAKIVELQSNELKTKDKKYQCEFCKKEYKFLSLLKIHERIHTGEKPYQCKCCQKYFTDRSTWRRHERIHQRKT